eukprot:3939016-Rhodomonas_salina.1
MPQQKTPNGERLPSEVPKRMLLLCKVLNSVLLSDPTLPAFAQGYWSEDLAEMLRGGRSME